MPEFDFTIDDVVRRIEELAAENPDHVYTPPDPNTTRCANVHKTEGGWVPGCIVGRALLDLGVPPEWFAEHDLINAASGQVLINLGLFDYRGGNGDHVDIQARRITRIQRLQDQRKPWGKAVAIVNREGI